MIPNRLRACGLPRGPNMRIRLLAGVSVASPTSPSVRGAELAFPRLRLAPTRVPQSFTAECMLLRRDIRDHRLTEQAETQSEQLGTTATHRASTGRLGISPANSTYDQWMVQHSIIASPTMQSRQTARIPACSIPSIFPSVIESKNCLREGTLGHSAFLSRHESAKSLPPKISFPGRCDGVGA
jgi:hypothetical protein